VLLTAALLVLIQAARPPAATPAPGALVQHSHLFGLSDHAIGYIPKSASVHPPLLVLLHGAGHRQVQMVQQLEAEADKRGIILLAPSSRDVTWDSVLTAEAPPSVDSPLTNRQSKSFGRTRDSDRVEEAITNLSKIVPVERAQTVLAGFSDGATFALAMGMSKDHDFAAVIAWSPGIAIRAERPARGRRVFVSHGRNDQLLKFFVTCSEIVPLLESEGAALTFLPFDGGHEVPESVTDAFLDAVFGPAPGQPIHRLDVVRPSCGASGTIG
jgi:phospholipase/carboxylesterase